MMPADRATLEFEAPRLLAAGDAIGAERLVLAWLAENPADARALYVHANILRSSGRAREATEVLERALVLDPDSADILLGLARAQRDARQELAAAASFIAHAAQDGLNRLDSLEEAAACLFRAGQREQSARLLADAGLLPEGIGLDPDSILEGLRGGRLNHRGAGVLLRTLAKADDQTAATVLDLAIWETGDETRRRLIVQNLPGRLLVAGRVEEALRIYQTAVEQGLPVGDFRPRSTKSSLASTDASLASGLFLRDRALFNVGLQPDAFRTARAWAPVLDAWGGVDLRGATAPGVKGASFELSAASGNAKSPVREIEAILISTNETEAYWRTPVSDLLPGQEYDVRLVPDSGAESGPIRFSLPAAEPDAVTTLAADNVGCEGAVFIGTAAPMSPGARYRFAYGSRADRLDQATDWAAFPPPRTGRSYERLYRQRGDWLPTCINPSWVTVAGGALPPGSPALSLGAPFAKDRNQLNGIGAHEMLAGLSWSPSLDASVGRIAFPIGGGVQDLRDAEVSFTVGGRDLHQFGAALHFWISHHYRRQGEVCTSQWALTASPIPDDVLAGGPLRKVTLRLRNDPRDWTYTGNNPREQGERALRYQRAALDTCLRVHNTPTVLIYAFGEVSRPPTGALLIQDVEVRYRNYSVLSPAAGAELVQFPAGSPDDPLRLTAGSQGYDDQLWTTDPSPSFPLEFTWKLRQAVTVTRLQINQHPYWPARDIEIVIEDEGGEAQRLWSGTLPEGRPDRDEPPSILVPVESGNAAATVTLRILSGYHPERCGLDGVEIYGEGALFDPDGQACSLSAEVGGLTPGEEVFYRIELEDGEDLIEGDVRVLSLPAGTAPLLHSAAPMVRPHDPACYVVRASAMGLETELWGELQLPDDTVFTGAKISLGTQPTSRHIYYTPMGFPDSPGTFHLHARNVTGDAMLQAPWPCR